MKTIITKWTTLRAFLPKCIHCGVFLGLFFSFLQKSNAQLSTYSKIDKQARSVYNFEDKLKEKVRKSKDLYVVYSDRENNTFYKDAYSQRVGGKEHFMKAFFVIDQKNNAYEIVAFEPKQIGKPNGLFAFLSSGKFTFSDIKNVTYIGWISKDKLLRFSHPIISPENLRPIKYSIGLDTVDDLLRLKDYMVKDTIRLYTGPALRERAKKTMKVTDLVYLFKYNSSKDAVLVSNLNHMNPADSLKRKMGWISSSLVRPIGQQQLYQITNQKEILMRNMKKQQDTILPRELNIQYLFNKQIPSQCSNPNRDTVQVQAALKVWNHDDNKLINVLGEDLYLKTVSSIREESKTINFHYVFDCDSNLRKKQYVLIGALQSLWIQLKEDPIYSGYRFTYSASSFGCANSYDFPKSISFEAWIDFIQKVLDNSFAPQNTSVLGAGISRSLEKIYNEYPNGTFENNIVFIVGEKQDLLLPSVENISKDLAKSSMKLMVYQLENGEEDSYQDYLLSAKELLSFTADNYTEYLKKYTVDSELLSYANNYTAIPSEDNIYFMKALESSVYQGGIAFPKLNQKMDPLTFSIAADSVLASTLHFNKTFFNSLDTYADKLGFLRSKPSYQVQKLLDAQKSNTNTFKSISKNNRDEQFLKAYHYIPSQNKQAIPGYYFTKEEIEVIIDNYRSLLPYYTEGLSDKDRKALRDLYKANIHSINKLLGVKRLDCKKPIAHLFYMKTGIPFQNKTWGLKTIKDLVRKDAMTNAQMKLMIGTLQDKIKELEQIIYNPKSTTIQGLEGYYFIPIEKTL